MSFEEYQKCINFIKENPELGELAYKQAKVGFSMPSMKKIEINSGNIEIFEIEPGKYNTPGKEGHISVQYDNLIKGELYEAWHPEEGEPRRKLNENEVRQMIKDFYLSV